MVMDEGSSPLVKANLDSQLGKPQGSMKSSPHVKANLISQLGKPQGSIQMLSKDEYNLCITLRQGFKKLQIT